MDALIIFIIVLITAISAVVIWLNMPGTFIMAGLVIVWGWASGFTAVSLNQALLILAIVVLLEILEFILSGVITRASGASKRSAMAAIIGGIAGTILMGSLFLIVGALIGLFGGSYAGAYLSERLAGKSKKEAGQAAMAALLGSIVAKALKSGAVVIIGAWMIQVLV